jgi:hypothetical protein
MMTHSPSTWRACDVWARASNERMMSSRFIDF